MPRRDTTHLTRNPINFTNGEVAILRAFRTIAKHGDEGRHKSPRPADPRRNERDRAEEISLATAQPRASTHPPGELCNPTRRVDDWRGCPRLVGSGGWPALAGASIHVMVPFPVAARRTVRADFPHTALGQGITLSPTEGRAWSATDV